ncbi:MAG: hypothetical protein QM757_41970 [Paludibaculum sp.]
MKPPTEPSPGARKVAVLMAALGLEASSKLLKQLEPEEIRQVSAALNALGPVPVDEAQQVLQEFEDKASTRQIMGCGGPGYTMKLLSGTFGEEFARQTGMQLSGKRSRKRLSTCWPRRTANNWRGSWSRNIRKPWRCSCRRWRRMRDRRSCRRSRRSGSMKYSHAWR